MSGEHATSGRRRAAAIVTLNLILVIYSLLVGNSYRETLNSVVTNMFLNLGWVSLVGVVSFLEASVVRGLVVRGGWRGSEEIRVRGGGTSKSWRELHLPLTIAILTLFAINMLVYDKIADGFFIDGQRGIYTLTRLRSDDETMQRAGVMAASKMTDPRVRKGLVEVIGKPGSNRALAAWALGKIGTANEVEPLLALLDGGPSKERGAAAVALGRLKHNELVPRIAEKLSKSDEPIESYLFAFGILGDDKAAMPIVKVMLRPDTAPDHLALASWALGKLDSDESCAVLQRFVSTAANPLTCATINSLTLLRCPDATERLIEAFEFSLPEDRCDIQKFVDTDGTSVELWPSGLYRVHLLKAIVQSGNHLAVPWLDKLAVDSSQVPQLRHLAKNALAHKRARSSNAGEQP